MLATILISGCTKTSKHSKINVSNEALDSDTAEFLVVDESESLPPTEVLNASEGGETADDLPVVISTDMVVRAQEENKIARTSPSSTVINSKNSVPYIINKGDTLMKIAFDKFGTIFGWRKIYLMNESTLNNPNLILAGTKIYLPKSVKAEPETNGMQKYNVKQGETLSKIATHLYGDSAQWKKLWKLNKKFLANPHQIYADFYIFYEVDQAAKSTVTKPRAPSSSKVN